MLANAVSKRLSELFPDARILISFRKHSGYIISSYRQYIQRGGAVDFEIYFDIAADRGIMTRDDFLFRPKIAAIERYFGHRPFVFLHEELSKNMDGLLRDLEGYLGGRAPTVPTSRQRRYNESIGYYPAKLLRRLNALTKSELNPEGKYELNRASLQRWNLTPSLICQKRLLFLPSRPFLSEERTEAID